MDFLSLFADEVGHVQIAKRIRMRYRNDQTIFRYVGNVKFVTRKISGERSQYELAAFVFNVQVLTSLKKMAEKN